MMTEKTVEQLKDEMLCKMFEEAYKEQYKDDVSELELSRDSDGRCYRDVAVQFGFEMFCAGRSLSERASTVDPKTGLKGCPFCGAKAMRYPDGDMEGYSVMCSGKMDGPILFNTNTRDTCPMGTFGYLSQEDADSAWNNRS
jgi:hypothetical protein